MYTLRCSRILRPRRPLGSMPFTACSMMRSGRRCSSSKTHTHARTHTRHRRHATGRGDGNSSTGSSGGSGRDVSDHACASQETCQTHLTQVVARLCPQAPPLPEHCLLACPSRGTHALLLPSPCPVFLPPSPSPVCRGHPRSPALCARCVSLPPLSPVCVMWPSLTLCSWLKVSLFQEPGRPLTCLKYSLSSALVPVTVTCSALITMTYAPMSMEGV